MLEAIKEPVDLRLRDEADLKQIADELRSETINAVAVTGGHLGAGLGVDVDQDIFDGHGSNSLLRSCITNA